MISNFVCNLCYIKPLKNKICHDVGCFEVNNVMLINICISYYSVIYS